MESILQLLRNSLGKSKVLSGEDLKDRYAHIWKMDQALQAIAVVLPQSTEEVSEVLKICFAHNQAVVVHGGLTNLVGSTDTLPDEVVISMEKMNNIIELDESSRCVTVQSGVILENIHNAVKEKGLLFPLNYGAKGSAQIGGAISTNAGGLQVLRFGMTRNLVLGLEAVLADGTIVSGLKKIIKDNSGYDVKQLFIGSEGTLGIVTKAVLKLVETPMSRTSAFVGFNDYEKVVEFLKFLDKRMAGTLSGYELIWKEAYIALTSPPAQVKPPLPSDYKYYVLVEGLGSNQEKDQALLEELLATAFEKEIILDAAIAYTESDLTWFWQVREDVHNMVSRCNNDQHFDVSLPISAIGDYVEKTIEKLYQIPEVEKVFAFGHVADGNIHFIIGKTKQSKTLINQINQVIYQPLQSMLGSVSAEHGIGIDKKAYLHLARTPAEIQLMKTLKIAMDPKNILNRGRVLDL